MKHIVNLAVCFSFLFALYADAGEVRIWTSFAGQHTIEAELVRISDDGKSVILRQGNGKRILVELDKVARVDQDYVAGQQEAENQPNLQPQRPAKPPAEQGAVANQADSPEKVLLRRKIDAVNDEDSGRLKVNLSEKGKEAVAEFLIMAEKARQKKYTESELSDLLQDIHYITGQNKFAKAGVTLPFGWMPFYRNVDVYVVCLAAYRVAEQNANNLVLTSTGRSSGALMNLYEREKAIIESLLPECNRLSGNAHDKEEKMVHPTIAYLAL